jgi:hypothetical protein
MNCFAVVLLALVHCVLAQQVSFGFSAAFKFSLVLNFDARNRNMLRPFFLNNWKYGSPVEL